MTKEIFGADFTKNRELLHEKLQVNGSFDLLSRTVDMEGRRAQLYFVDGMVLDDTLAKILELLMKVSGKQLAGLETARAFADRIVPYGETDVTDDVADFMTFVLSGAVGMLVEGCKEAILIDVRSYPARPVMEPENDRVLRGPREGFVEILVKNTALLRRRLRDPALAMELIQAGERSHTDFVLCYLRGKADEKLLERLRGKLRAISANTLTMGLESLIEATTPRRWWNPFPRARCTERPDCAAASVAEGQIILLMDNCPAALILPTGIFDFLQDTNDYCFLPITGTYLRWLRLLVSALTVLLTPLWYFFMQHAELLPEWAKSFTIHEPIAMPLLPQLLVIELAIGALKLASLNTPAALSNSFAVIGSLVLGEFAVRAELMAPEAVLVMAFVAVSNFAQPSYELGYALAFSRVLLLVLCALFGVWGLLGGVACILLAISCTKTLAGNCYWYPLIPFNGKALRRLFFRVPLHKENS
ncbi:MAG: spore germination protein [Oscillospiraceae bacterium]|jgi:stage V sporulation protein AF|nr:spore germination protein [Oscillospiraceae bacterium]